MGFPNGDIKLSANFELNIAKPLDARFIVNNITDRNAISFKYAGMIVWVVSEGTHHKLLNDLTTWEVFAGSTSGVTNLTDLRDVIITSPVNNNVLIYNSASTAWVNGTLTIPSGATAGNGIDITSGAISLDVENYFTPDIIQMISANDIILTSNSGVAQFTGDSVQINSINGELQLNSISSDILLNALDGYVSLYSQGVNGGAYMYHDGSGISIDPSSFLLESVDGNDIELRANSSDINLTANISSGGINIETHDLNVIAHKDIKLGVNTNNFEFKINSSQGATYIDGADMGGIRYASDYAYAYTNRSLVDKQYVDNAIISNTSGVVDLSDYQGNIISLKSATSLNIETTDPNANQLNINSNGGSLNINSNGGGVTVQDLQGGGVYIKDAEGGGIYIQNDFATGDGIYLQNYSGNGIYLSSYADNGATLKSNIGIDLSGVEIDVGDQMFNVVSSGTGYVNIVGADNTNIEGGNSYVYIDDNGIYMYAKGAVGGGKFEFYLDPVNDVTTFTDNTGSPKGLQYTSNYSPTFTNRSLVDKEYVDNAVTSGSISLIHVDDINMRLTGSNGNTAIHWSDDSRALFDVNGNPSLWFNYRVLTASDGADMIDWENKVINSTFGTPSINWASRVLVDENIIYSIDWRNRYATDNIGNISIDWQERTLYSSQQLPIVNWKYDAVEIFADDVNGSNALIRMKNVSKNNYINLEQIAIDGWNDIRDTNFDSINSVYFKNSSSGYISGDNSFSYTNNGGSTWTSMPLTGTTFVYGAHFNDDNNGYVISTNSAFNVRLFKTTNGGSSWSFSNVTGLDFTIPSNVLPFHVFNNSVIYIFGVVQSGGSGGKMIKTTNGGSNWSVVTNDLSSNMFFITCNYFINQNIGYIAGFNNSFVGTIGKTTNGGANWTYTNIPSVLQIWDIYFKDSNNGYAVGTDNNGIIIRTTDGGNTWETPIQLPNTGVVRSITFTDTNTGYAVGRDINNFGVIFKTIDGGVTWDLIYTTTNLDTFRHTTNVGSDNIYIVGESGLGKGSILYTTTAGESFNKLRITNNSDRGMLTNLDAPTSLYDATNKEYVDNAIASASSLIHISDSDMQLYDEFLDISVDWNERTLNRGIVNGNSLDWGNMLLLKTGITSVDWSNRNLVNESGNIALHYGTNFVIGNTTTDKYRFDNNGITFSKAGQIFGDGNDANIILNGVIGNVNIGIGNTTSNNNATVVGSGNTTNADFSTAIGNFSSANYIATAVGAVVTATNQYTTAIGNFSNATALRATAIGSNVNATALASTVVGNTAQANGTGTIALGYGVRANAEKSVVIGSAPNSSVGIYNNLPYSIMMGVNSDASSLTIFGGNGSSGSLGNIGVNNNNPSARLDITQGNASLAPLRIRKNNVDKTTSLNQGEIQYTSDNKLKIATTTDGTTLKTIAFTTDIDNAIDSNIATVTVSQLQTLINTGGIKITKKYLITNPQDGGQIVVEGNSTSGVSPDSTWYHTTIHKPFGLFRISAGSSGSVTSVTVGGTQLITSPIPYNTSITQTVTNLVANINSYSSTSGYKAYAVSEVCVLEYLTPTASINGATVAATATGTLTIANINNMRKGANPTLYRFGILYNATNDRIIQCRDDNNNLMAYSVSKITFLGTNPISVFRWNDSSYKRNTFYDVDFLPCFIEDTIFGFSANRFDQESQCQYNIALNTSYIYGNNIAIGGTFVNNYILNISNISYNSSFNQTYNSGTPKFGISYNAVLSNLSGGGILSNTLLSNGCYINSNILTTGTSRIRLNTLSGRASSIVSNTLSVSATAIESNSLIGDSATIASNIFSNTNDYIRYNTLLSRLSSISSNTISGSSSEIAFNTLTGASVTINSNSITGGSSFIRNNDLAGANSSINTNTLGISATLIENNSISASNASITGWTATSTSKNYSNINWTNTEYSFVYTSLALNNTANRGQASSPIYTGVVPTKWYNTAVDWEGTGLTGSSSGASIIAGIETDNTSSGFTTKLVTTLNVPQSPSGLTRTKATALRNYIVTPNAGVTAGSFKIYVTGKIGI
jgi:photosystem II stability/assembly factor-like uncharacterized protein